MKGFPEKYRGLFSRDAFVEALALPVPHAPDFLRASFDKKGGGRGREASIPGRARVRRVQRDSGAGLAAVPCRSDALRDAGRGARPGPGPLRRGDQAPARLPGARHLQRLSVAPRRRVQLALGQPDREHVAESRAPRNGGSPTRRPSHGRARTARSAATARGITSTASRARRGSRSRGWTRRTRPRSCSSQVTSSSCRPGPGTMRRAAKGARSRSTCRSRRCRTPCSSASCSTSSSPPTPAGAGHPRSSRSRGLPRGRWIPAASRRSRDSFVGQPMPSAPSRRITRRWSASGRRSYRRRASARRASAREAGAVEAGDRLCVRRDGNVYARMADGGARLRVFIGTSGQVDATGPEESPSSSESCPRARSRRATAPGGATRQTPSHGMRSRRRSRRSCARGSWSGPECRKPHPPSRGCGSRLQLGSRSASPLQRTRLPTSPFTGISDPGSGSPPAAESGSPARERTRRPA